jgi:hypothetical protein
MASLLAVDLGLRTGLALYGSDGRLRWYRSQNFGSRSRLKRGVYGLLKETADLAWLIVEGGGPLADIWLREAERRMIQVQQIDAGLWRRRLLHQREHRHSAQAKQTADDLARRIIEWADASRPTSLRHDAAEAILIGLWGVLEVGWLKEVPDVLRR